MTAAFTIVGEGTKGGSALQLAVATGPDVILMAIGLPDLDGIRAARKIMQARPVPIVLLSSHYDAETIERAKRAGVMGYLIKPRKVIERAKGIFITARDFRWLVGRCRCKFGPRIALVHSDAL